MKHCQYLKQGQSYLQVTCFSKPKQAVAVTAVSKQTLSLQCGLIAAELLHVSHHCLLAAVGLPQVSLYCLASKTALSCFAITSVDTQNKCMLVLATRKLRLSIS